MSHSSLSRFPEEGGGKESHGEEGKEGKEGTKGEEGGK